MLVITSRMPQSLPRGQEGVYLCLLSLQEELENENQQAPKKRVCQSYGF
jgi:hypothetical protein